MASWLTFVSVLHCMRAYCSDDTVYDWPGQANNSLLYTHQDKYWTDYLKKRILLWLQTGQSNLTLQDRAVLVLLVYYILPLPTNVMYVCIYCQVIRPCPHVYADRAKKAINILIQCTTHDLQFNTPSPQHPTMDEVSTSNKRRYEKVIFMESCTIT